MANILKTSFTPQAVRWRWDAFKLRLEIFLTEKAQSLSFRSGATGLLIAINYFLIFGPVPAADYINSIYAFTYQIFFLGLCVWGPLGLLLQNERFPNWRGHLMAMGSLLHILAVVFLLGKDAPFPDQALQISVMILQPCLAYLLCALCGYIPVWTAWLTSLLIAGFSYWVFLAASPVSEIAWISLKANPARYLMFITFFALQFHYLKLRFKNESQRFSYIFNPIQSLLPLPLPLDIQHTATFQTSARGILNLSFATLALGLFLAMAWIGLPAQGWGSATLGYFHHFFYLFYLVAFGVGLLQWCGFVVPHPSDLALLSASPHMRWRRWNWYTYKWLSLTIFFPLLQRTGSRLIALVISFLCVGLLHLNVVFYVPVSGLPGTELKPYILKLFAYYMGHAAAIWTGFLFPASWTNESRSSSWTGVVLTWIMVTCIFSLYY